MSADPRHGDATDLPHNGLSASTEPQIVPDADEFASIQQLLVEAAAHAHVGEDVPAGARLRPVKRAVMKAFRPVTSFQRVYNTKVLLALTRLKDHFEMIARSEYGAPTQLNRLNVSIATLDVALDQVNDRIRELEARTATIEASELHMDMALDQIRDLEARTATTEAGDLQGDLHRRLAGIDQLQDRLHLLETKQNVIFREARREVGEELDVAAMRTLATELDQDDAQLYADMEDLFRGSRAAVRELLGAYLTDVAAVPGRGPVIDIGSGRGEWLELLRDNDINAYGLELNPITAAECVERGLDVRKEDAVAHLQHVPEGSLRAITGFHIAEHLSLDALLSVIESAFVALSPGGVLVLETPNCTNLSVGAASFYLDPTHVKPLHPQLLEFLCHHRGFSQVEVRYLHPRRDTENDPAASADLIDSAVVDEINWALFGPMDYAVIATRGEGVSAAAG